jgi:zinc/manganese transport system substrate-binding protein
LKSLALILFLAASAASASEPVRVVAAENFYGDLARQIGGAHVAVTSILTNPDQDPHLFEASPETAKAIAGAKILIANGAGYDPWMQKLAAASPAVGRQEIDVGVLANGMSGSNPHLWYGTDNMKLAAKALSALLGATDPVNASEYQRNEAAFEVSLKPIEAMLAGLTARYKGVPVAASEPVFDFAALAIGLDVREQKFALAVMNDAEPSPSDVATFESDLKGRKVRAMIYNSQASEPAVERLVALAKANGVPVVGVTETEPPNLRYQDWLKGELDALDHALSARIN